MEYSNYNIERLPAMDNRYVLMLFHLHIMKFTFRLFKKFISEFIQFEMIQRETYIDA